LSSKQNSGRLAGGPADPMVESFAGLSSAAVSDAMDRLSIAGQVRGVQRFSGDGGFAGRAVTLRYGPVGIDGGTVGDYIDDVPVGAVLLLANGGSTVGTVWGGLLSEVASLRGVAATVIDGLCRDIDTARRVGYSLYARAVWMRTGKDRVRLDAIGEPVNVGGVRAVPGDIVVGDGDGVVVVPRPLEQDVLAVAEEIDRAERDILSAVRGGERLDAARARLGYHRLQSRKGG
jgi:4-hydroxy-4-methyl-2-oxoglutarate aldolase